LSEGGVDAFTEVVAGGSLLFFSSLMVSITGLVYWFIVSRVLGVGSVGIISSLVSAAGLATALTSAGLPIASLREFAAKRLAVLKPSIAASTVFALASALLAYLLSIRLVGVKEFMWFPVLMGFIGVLSMPLAQSLIGLGLFKQYFRSVFVASIIKVLLGTAPLVIAATLIAPLVGYLSYPLIIALLAIYYMLKFRNRFSGASNVGFISGVKSLVKLSLSNYPFILSTQVMTLLSVYGFAVVTGKVFGTGVLYLSLMIVLVISSVTGSLLTASLSSPTPFLPMALTLSFSPLLHFSSIFFILSSFPHCPLPLSIASFLHHVYLPLPISPFF